MVIYTSVTLIIERIIFLSKKTKPPYFSKKESQNHPVDFTLSIFECLLYKVPHLNFDLKSFI
jgi:hypothetical protein